MQIKNRFLGLIFIFVFIGGLAFMTWAILFTAFPVKIVQRLLLASGHEAQGIEMLVHSFSHREIRIAHLHLSDDIKDILIKNLILELKQDKILNLSADQISFRDRTKPNQSLRETIQKWKTPADGKAPTCIENLQLQNVEISLTYAAEPISAKEISGQKLCFGENLSFSQLKIDSKDLILDEAHLSWKVNHQQFYDLPQETLILFQRSGQSLKLYPANRESLLRLIK